MTIEEPDFTTDEIDDMWEFGGAGLDDNDYMVEGCLFPGDCVMPGPHYLHECYTPAMIENQYNNTAHRQDRSASRHQTRGEPAEPPMTAREEREHADELWVHATMEREAEGGQR